MLKKSLVLAAVLAATISTYGQGTIVFNTQSTGKKITLADGSFPTGTAYFAQLYASATADESSLTAIGKAYNFRAGNNAGYVSVPAAEQATTVPSVGNGGATYLQIRGWAAEFASYEAALAGGGAVGKSAVWTQDTGALATATSPADPPPPIAGFDTFVIQVPEPSVLALVGVGAAALLFRRRK